MSGGKSTSCRLLFGFAGNDFREGLLMNVLGLTWAMAGFVRLVPSDGPTEQRHLRVRRAVRILRVGQRPVRPRSRTAQRRFRSVLCHSTVTYCRRRNPSEHGML